MSNGHYLGGSTIIGLRSRWSDNADFPQKPTLGTLPSAAKRNSKRRKFKQRNAVVDVSATVVPLIVPVRQAQLIISILKDLGHDPPKKRNRLNSLLRQLIEDGVIVDDGTVNKQHPLIQQWVEKPEA